MSILVVRSPWILSGLLCALFSARLAAQVTPVFESAVLPLGFSPTDAAVTDYDGDGDVDIVVRCEGLTVVRGEGAGAFDVVQKLASLFSQDLQAADLDGSVGDEVLVSRGGSLVVLHVTPDDLLAPTATIDSPSVSLRDLAIADLDVDGDLDVAAACSGSTLASLLNQGDGSLVLLSALAGPSTSAIAVADFDGDGIPDAAPTSFNDKDLHLFTGVGDGTFVPGATLPDVFQSSYFTGLGHIEAGDLNEDSIPDLVVASVGVATLLGQGNGAFLVGQVIPNLDLVGGGDFVVFDVDEDGHEDLVLGSDAVGDVTVLRGGGDGELVEAVQVPCGERPYTVLVADADGDDHADLLVIDASGFALDVIFGSGCGVPQAGQHVTGEDSAHTLRAADLDADGRDDLLLGEGDTLVALTGDGEGDFAPAWQLPLELPPFAWMSELEAADLDGDGWLDVLGSVVVANRVFVAYGAGAGAIDPPMLLDAGDGSSVETADVNADGSLDVVASENGGLVVWAGQPGGGLAPSVGFSGGGGSPSLADADEDGYPDACALELGGVAVLHGDPDTLFGAVDHYSVALPYGRAHFGDLNQDGHQDLLIAGSGEDGARFLAGHGAAGFDEFKTIVPGLDEVSRAIVRPLDSDSGDEALLLSPSGLWELQPAGGGWSLPFGHVTTRFISDFDLADVDSDGDRDVVFSSLTTGTGLFGKNHALTTLRRRGPWMKTDDALPGAAGSPVLLGEGLPAAGGSDTFTLCHAAPFAPAILVAGTSDLHAPFKGGTLVPLPAILVGPLPCDASGTFTTTASWHPHIPAGVFLILQAWIQDASGPQGWTSSQALVTTTQ